MNWAHGKLRRLHLRGCYLRHLCDLWCWNLKSLNLGYRELR